MDKPEAGLRQRVFAWALARYNDKYEKFAVPYKHRLFSDLAGTVVEIGPGTGANLRYFTPDKVRWIGIDPNPFMHCYLRAEAERLGIAVELHVGTADRLPVPDDGADAVISTLVLCCVPVQRRSMREIIRVLKPGGKFIFIEHVAAPAGTRLRRMQNLITPLWKRLGDGCHPNRDTAGELQRAGFASITYDRITAPLPIVSPQIVGVATKADR
jgi:SAM-dependent methyltransferase